MRALCQFFFYKSHFTTFIIRKNNISKCPSTRDTCRNVSIAPADVIVNDLVLKQCVKFRQYRKVSTVTQKVWWMTQSFDWYFILHWPLSIRYDHVMGRISFIGQKVLTSQMIAQCNISNISNSLLLIKVSNVNCFSIFSLVK